MSDWLVSHSGLIRMTTVLEPILQLDYYGAARNCCCCCRRQTCRPSPACRPSLEIKQHMCRPLERLYTAANHQNSTAKLEEQTQVGFIKAVESWVIIADGSGPGWFINWRGGFTFRKRAGVWLKTPSWPAAIYWPSTCRKVMMTPANWMIVHKTAIPLQLGEALLHPIAAYHADHNAKLGTRLGVLGPRFKGKALLVLPCWHTKSALPPSSKLASKLQAPCCNRDLPLGNLHHFLDPQFQKVFCPWDWKQALRIRMVYYGPSWSR